MRKMSSWSLSLGRWAGVQVALHSLFLLLAVLALYASTLPPGDGVPHYGAAGIAILLLSLAMHELAHCLTAFRLGGTVEAVVVGPVGGLWPALISQDGRRDAVVALAGPAVNLCVFLFSGAILIAAGQDFAALLNPVQPSGLLAGDWPVIVVKLTCWINWVLFLVNLLPAFPVDGGTVTRAWLTPMFGYSAAVLIVARCAKLTALGLIILSAVIQEYETGPAAPVPVWVPLALLALLLFFGAQHEQQHLEEVSSEEELLGYDFSQGYTSLERHFDSPKPPRPNGVRRWLEDRRRARVLRQRQLEQAEEQRVDEILARLHSQGMQSLTGEERELLHRVSVRYRNRQSL